MLQPSRRQLLQGSLALAVCSPWRALAAALVDGAWRDPARERPVPFLLRLPAGPGPWPLIVYSHGLGGSREGGAAWGEAWAAAGLAVLHLQHAGSDFDAVQGGIGQLRAAASAEQLRQRVLDVRFALDEAARLAAAGQAPWAAMRLDATGMAGHSFGALTTQALAGQHHAQAQATAAFAEPRFKAFVALSPSAPADRRVSVQQAFGAITRPFLAVTGSLDGDPLQRMGQGSDGSAAEARASVYDGLPPGQRALLWLDGADHMTFGGGRPPAAGRRALLRPQPRNALSEAREAAHRAAVAQVSTLWWRSHLLRDADAAAALANPGRLQPPLVAPARFTSG